jgi:hypothetical protein
MPDDPPRRKPGIAADIVESGAVHEFRHGRPIADRMPARPPPLPPEHKPIPVARPAPRTQTLIGQPAPVPPPAPSEPPERDSVHDAIQSADTLTGELAGKNNRLAEKDAQLAAAEARVEQLRVQLDAARVVVPPVKVPSIRAFERSERHVAVLKVMGALAAILAAGTTYLSVRANTVVEPRVDAAQERQQAAKLATDADHELMQKMREYLRADRARQDCFEGQIGSAFIRGTGHRITGIADASVEWAEQQRPPAKPPVVYDHSIFFTVTPCAPASHPP